MEEMNNQETIKICVEEFSRLQEWMEMAEKESTLYKSMKTRYKFMAKNPGDRMEVHLMEIK